MLPIRTLTSNHDTASRLFALTLRSFTSPVVTLRIELVKEHKINAKLRCSLSLSEERGSALLITANMYAVRLSIIMVMIIGAAQQCHSVRIQVLQLDRIPIYVDTSSVWTFCCLLIWETWKTPHLISTQTMGFRVYLDGCYRWDRILVVTGVRAPMCVSWSLTNEAIFQRERKVAKRRHRRESEGAANQAYQGSFTQRARSWKRTIIQFWELSIEQAARIITGLF